jgi:hypothetical protein
MAANGRWRGNSMKKQFMIGSSADHRHQPEMRTDGSLLRSRTNLFLTFRPFARSINAGHRHLCRSGCTCMYVLYIHISQLRSLLCVHWQSVSGLPGAGLCCLDLDGHSSPSLSSFKKPNAKLINAQPID